MRQRAPDPWSPVRHREHRDHGHHGSSPMMRRQGVLSIFFLFLLCVDTTSCLRELYFPWPPEAQGPATLWKWCFSTFQAQSPGWWPRLECKPTHLAIKRAYFFFLEYAFSTVFANQKKMTAGDRKSFKLISSGYIN